MLTFKELSERKKTKVKINPSQKELTEKKRKSRPIDKDEPEVCESVDLTEEWVNASVEVAAEYFYAEGINEDGLDNIINEVGLEDFVEFVIDPIEELNEERSARKASVKAPSYEKVKAKVDAADAAKKKAKPVAKATVRKPAAKPEKKAATVKKVEKAVKTAKKTQPQKPTSKKGLLGKVGDAVKKGVERHNKARAAGKVPEKRVKEFAKGFKKGVSGTLKFAGKVKKAVSEEVVDEATRLKKEKGYDKGGSKDKALNFVKSKIRKEYGKPEGQRKKEKGAKSPSGTGKYLKRAQDKKAYVAKAKKAGFKSAQDYTNTMARYGGEDNYKKGKGLGT